MRLRILTITCTVLMVFSCSTLFAQDALQQLRQEHLKLYESCHSAVVAISQKGNPRQVHPSLGNGVGSGVIISEDGLILTTLDNIARKNSTIKIIHVNHHIYKATVINQDPHNGIALLQIVAKEGERFSYLPLGDSNSADIGSLVLTLSNAYGSLSQNASVSYSAGVISGRYLPEGKGLYLGEVLETDAAVNPGSYGGALINAKGELIGLLVNSISYNRWLGTAVPVNQIKAVLPWLKDPLMVITPGNCPVRTNTSDDTIVIAAALKGESLPDGLTGGETILRFNGRPVEDGNDFLDRLGSLPGGTRASLLVEDAKKSQRVVTLVFGSAAGIRIPSKPEHIDNWQPGSMGCIVRTALGQTGGARIKSAEALGAASKAGLQKDDIIHTVNGVQILTASMLKSLFNKLPVGTNVKIGYLRDGKLHSVTARLRGRIT